VPIAVRGQASVTQTRSPIMTTSDNAQAPAPSVPGPSVPAPEVQPGEANDRIVQANGVDLCVETFGDPADLAILLISGAAAAMDWWEDEFCERLAAGARFVIRYDHRDTGRSVHYEPGAPQYTMGDLVADAVRLLDAFGLASAHLVGISMGGAIAQLIALDYPDRVTSLTLISTSAGAGDPDLPAMSEELRAHFAETADVPDWSDRAAVIDYLVDSERAFASRSRPFDEAAKRDLAGRVFDRTVNMASSMTNHRVIDGGDRWRERLAEIRAPTLVIHGTEDPLFPYDHAVALAKEIPGAHLLALEQVGHEMPPRPVWDVVVRAILQHSAR
jgi:pimeloyl-ACP methyl ester carboxylesterase